MATKAAPARNLPAPQTYTPEQIQAALIEGGLIQPSSAGSEITRIKVTGNNFMVGDDIIAVYNPIKKDPALLVQIVDAPVILQQLWFTPELAQLTGHDELLAKMGERGMFCKSHEAEPNEAMKYSENGFECRACPVNSFVHPDSLPMLADGTRAKKCAMGADLDLRILNDDGTLTDKTVYTMSLSQTGLVEFQGGRGRNADRSKGYSQINPKSRHDGDDGNFLFKLMGVGLAKGLNPAAIMTSLRLGQVIAEVRSLPATNERGTFNWSVPSFTPIDILADESVAALPGETNADDNGDGEALPF